VCATQELHRRLEAQQTKINELENAISIMMARLEAAGL
jgi:type II secretory pathway component PulJ